MFLTLPFQALGSSSSDKQNAENLPENEQNGDSSQGVDAALGKNIDPDSCQKTDVDSDFWSSDYDENNADDFSDSDSCTGNEVTDVFTAVCLMSSIHFSFPPECKIFPDVILYSYFLPLFEIMEVYPIVVDCDCV